MALGFTLTDVRERKRAVCIIPKPPFVHTDPSVKLSTILTVHTDVPVIRLTLVPVAKRQLNEYIKKMHL